MTDAEKIEKLRTALELATGAVYALMEHGNVGEKSTVRFTGRWEHHGTWAFGAILDATNEALEVSKP